MVDNSASGGDREMMRGWWRRVRERAAGASHGSCVAVVMMRMRIAAARRRWAKNARRLFLVLGGVVFALRKEPRTTRTKEKVGGAFLCACTRPLLLPRHGAALCFLKARHTRTALLARVYVPALTNITGPCHFDPRARLRDRDLWITSRVIPVTIFRD